MTLALDFNDAPLPVPAAVPGPARKWSPLQSEIFAHLARHDATSLVINAVAGSGKTTTVVEGCNVIRRHHGADPLFLAFNKSIADELGQRGVRASTMHSLGFKAVGQAFGRVQVEGRKTSVLLAGLAPDLRPAQSAEVRALVGMAKTYGIVPDSWGGDVGAEGAIGLVDDDEAEWDRLAEHHDIEVQEWDKSLGLAREVLRRSLKATGTVDFDDMIYVPLAMCLPMRRESWVVVDEAQDISGVQRMLLQRLTGGRIVAVGDRHQAIYGFRGADTSSLDRIRDAFSARELPLSVTYRCAKSIVDEAKKLVPHLQAAPNAPDGIVETVGRLPKDVAAGDLIVCRLTRPLIDLALSMIGAGTPAMVMGRDIGQGLLSTLDKLPRRGEMLDRIDEWAKRRIALAERKEDDAEKQRIQDRAECLRILTVRTGGKDVGDIKTAIERIFGDDQADRRVKLATIHKSKGLEADRVFLLERSLLPAKFARSGWQLEQEQNLEYVALTRAKTRLIVVEPGLLGGSL